MNEEGGRVGRVARESKNRSTIKRKSGRVKAEMLLVPLGDRDVDWNERNNHEGQEITPTLLESRPPQRL
jgi:hypothetical protein